MSGSRYGPPGTFQHPGTSTDRCTRRIDIVDKHKMPTLDMDTEAVGNTKGTADIVFTLLRVKPDLLFCGATGDDEDRTALGGSDFREVPGGFGKLIAAPHERATAMQRDRNYDGIRCDPAFRRAQRARPPGVREGVRT